jgi:hypothetical protein
MKEGISMQMGCRARVGIRNRDENMLLSRGGIGMDEICCRAERE